MVGVLVQVVLCERVLRADFVGLEMVCVDCECAGVVVVGV